MQNNSFLRAISTCIHAEYVYVVVRSSLAGEGSKIHTTETSLFRINYVGGDVLRVLMVYNTAPSANPTSLPQVCLDLA